MSFQTESKLFLTDLENFSKKGAEFVGQAFITDTVLDENLAPVAYGELRQSFVVTDSFVDSDGIVTVRMGNNKEYSIEQHEDLLNHPSGFPIDFGFPHYAPAGRNYRSDANMTATEKKYWAGYFAKKDKVRFKAKFLEMPLLREAEEISRKFAVYVERRLSGR